MNEALQAVVDRICPNDPHRQDAFGGIHAWHRDGLPPNPIVLTCGYCGKSYRYVVTPEPR